ncbi:glycoside hydrolase [candidate division WOR-1 bacterium RIFOXYA2_FULL_36_21]|uniref:Glycoside hydrolase n=1 Tax=candidate division WOR-1 bacterium RIFOXYB2_FULL_36_35 TaxID=1802578 RepID=A0A1F4S685_UNCSA|nr:MAG: glycoside hydrolase [candidate division WOR-1 bacterium RIFOXYA2_FULL_36_21]OGC14369.1 MAG: glycoside hydrolase [candidate division WOR-1 bacterium RIFOXYA12_FULL_36_13]OGC15955.1 MAG: glycoside hydrolase [candidate division WOR-1 bacterium RIFOXYB2_FULL_36_35]
MTKGYLALVLHAHLPYVRHPEYEDFLEEDWLYEAITETYIPLLNVFENLISDGIDFRITMSITPTLVAMLADELLQNRYIKHLDNLIELSYKEIERTKWDGPLNELAHMYNRIFIQSRIAFVERYHRNLLNGFKKIQDAGKLEIITCGATHGFLPLMEVNKKAVEAQIKIAAIEYEKHFGRRPNGIWLPECGYNPSDDQILKDAGIKFFITDTHGILHGSPRPKYGVFAPVYCKSGVAAFGRDVESGKAVWSAEEGYPGDYVYREFYRDIGFDLDFDYVKPYISPDGIRINTGIKYHKITGNTDYKELYDRKSALYKAADHAGNFMFNRGQQIEYLYDFLGKKPIILSPYDAELFGHWWYEGPEWLNFLIRKIACDQNIFKLTTPFEYLKENPKNQVSTPSLSSWGYKGYAEVWLSGCNDWMYRHLHKAADRMVELAQSYPNADGILCRALNQAARELLLAQSSDWGFIMKMGTMVEYAVKRFKDHIGRFTKLYDQIRSNSIDESYVKDLEWKDNLFMGLDYRAYL